MAQLDDYASLSQVVHDSPALRIRSRLDHLGVNFFVFARNHRDLKRLLQLTKSPEMILHFWDMKNRRELDAVTDDVTRLLHNYLAGAKTLVDHTRVLVADWYTETEFMKEYNSQVLARFTTSPLAGFIEGLRNYSLHYSLPFAMSTMKVTSSDGRAGNLDQLELEFTLSRTALRHWSNWPAKARVYLDLPDDEISVEMLADDYFQQVLDFHKWVDERLRAIHRDELAWLSEMQEKIVKLMPDDEKQARGLA
jgi:hypothetical protein